MSKKNKSIFHSTFVQIQYCNFVKYKLGIIMKQQQQYRLVSFPSAINFLVSAFMYTCVDVVCIERETIFIAIVLFYVSFVKFFDGAYNDKNKILIIRERNYGNDTIWEVKEMNETRHYCCCCCWKFNKYTNENNIGWNEVKIFNSINNGHKETLYYAVINKMVQFSCR